MKILGEIDKTALGNKYGKHHQSGLILAVALGKLHCYLAEICPEDFRVILINSSAERRPLEQSEYPSLWDVVQQIRADHTFLSSNRSDGGLNGLRVAHYLNLLTENQHFTSDCFILDSDAYPDMNSRGKYYVIDGMHRLIAFGLATNMERHCFPVQVYYCTDRR